MRSRGEIVGAVDFGSREVRVLIARNENSGPLQVLGIGTAPGRGCVSQGVIQDRAAAQMALRRAIVQAEKDAHTRVHSLFCGINGRNVETFIREEKVKLEREVVERMHLDDAIEMASRDVMEAGKHVVSSITAQEWYVDDLRVIDPLGLRGHVLKTRVHFARIPSVVEDNIAHCIESQHKALEDVIFLPLAASLGCLTPEDTELGVAILDMGRSTIGLAVHREGRILGTHCFELGGYHITRDVAAGLHVSFEEADELILEYGIPERCIVEDHEKRESTPPMTRGTSSRAESAEIKLKTAVQGAPAIVPRADLDVIIYERTKEMMMMVRQHLKAKGHLDQLVRGLVLTGGSATIKNYVKLAEAIFEVPCRVGVPDSIEAVASMVRAPQCSSVVGIARHGIAYRMAARNGRLEGRGLMAVGARKLGRAFHKYFF